VYNNLPRQAFFTLVQEAKKAGIAVAGHKPVRVSTVEASQAGMKSLEHARFLLWDSFAGADSLRRQQDPMRLDNTQLRQRMLAEHDTALLQAMFRVLRHNATWYTPTHLTRKADAFAGDQEFRARYKDVNPIMRFLAFEDLDATLQEDPTALARQVYRDFYVKGLEISGQASRQGIKLLAGSDVPELPGSSLHEELVELARAGLPPMEVLRTATLYPAQYYGLDSLYGSIERGKRADLVLLSANPLQDIRHTVAIQGVIMDGRYVDQHSLATLASVVNKRSASWDMQAKLLWDIMVYMTL
jgi:imidazolonepropionase-like amidohydrolase